MMYLKKIPQMLPSAVYKTLMQLLASLVGVAALKALNTSAGVNQLLLASVEGMALAANFNADLRLVSRVWITLPHAQVMVQST